MNSSRPVGWLLLLIAYGCLDFSAAAAPAQTGGEEIRVVEIQGTVELSTDGGKRWVLTQTNQVLRAGDHLRTGQNSRAALRVSAATVLPFKALTEIEILPPDAAGAQPGLHIWRGILSFFHKEKPGHFRIVTPSATAGVDGTEFVIAVDSVNGKERTILAVVDGTVSFGNGRKTITLTNGERAVVEIGGEPVRIAGFVVNNLLQWAFYYPAVLDPRDLALSADEEQALRESLTAYRAGDLLAALAAYGTRQPNAEAERIYRAALLLAVGEVDQTSDALLQVEQANASERGRRLAAALRQQIAAVKREPAATTREPELTTELLAASYYEQSRAAGDETLKRALNFATRATTNSREFGFAWVRVAELEFSFGRTDRANDALNKNLAVSPRNAQALSLKGFLLAAQNKPREAIEWFDRALAIDAALANAWLGRGLCRIRRGDSTAGREDLLIAAALEPRRAQLRSYLGKSFGDAGDGKRALHELDLAKQIDPNDPGAWLYSALVKADHNRLNEAIQDLEKSQELNENRSVYRSSVLIEQDKAVRSANLAQIYADNGMPDVALREAARAVSYDYANYSAHLFLANSYDSFRDPNRINLRYEIPSESEYLVANLLAPVGAGLLAQSVSQQEYSKLFERDRFGVSSSTEYLDRGAWKQHGAQFGTFGNSSYLFEALYRNDPGQQPNGDFEERELRLHLKQQITPQDTLYFRAIDYDVEAGDVRQYYDPRFSSRGLRTRERQDPIMHLGYHHEWDPGVHTLLFAGRLVDRFTLTDPLQPTLFLIRPPGEPPTEFHALRSDLRYHREREGYSAELQQIFQYENHNTILGGRFQIEEIRTRNLQTNPVVDIESLLTFFDPTAPMAKQRLSSDYERWSLYAYHYWKVLPSLQLVGGLTYDKLTYPENFHVPPLSESERETDRVSPKAGFVWTPAPRMALRFAYTRGINIDQEFLIEPSQVAGFNQLFRSVLPESVSGTDPGVKVETFNALVEQKLGSGTYLGLLGQILNSEHKRTLGAFRFDGSTFFAVPSGTSDSLDYTEQSLLFTVNQLVEKEWSLGASYRLTHADLQQEFTELGNPTATFGVRRNQDLSAILHQVVLQSAYNHSSGFFLQLQALWTAQSNDGYSPELASDDFWHLNAFVGYRFPRRRAEVRVGLLNLTDQDYRLNPLTLYNELPRSRTFTARLQFNF